MTRADLTEEVHQAIGMRLKDSDLVVCAIFDGIVRALRSGDKVEIRGFGSFHTRQGRGPVGRNPKTGAQVEVPPKRIPSFKPTKELRELVDSLNVNVSKGDSAIEFRSSHEPWVNTVIRALYPWPTIRQRYVIASPE